MAVNKERIKLWVDALRSGDYQQGFRAMSRIKTEGGDSFVNCCLGVACEVAMANGLELKKQFITAADLPAHVEADFSFHVYGKQRTGGTLPQEVVD